MRTRINSRLWSLCTAICALLTGCTEPPSEEPPEPPASKFVADGPGCLSSGEGFVQGELYGELAMTLRWDNAGTQCDGMSRPDGGGARLRFARRWQDSDADLVLIVGISDLEAGATGNGLAANVTLIDERYGRFFSNGGVPNCWVDIYAQEPLDEQQKYRVNGILYCSGALASTQGTASIRPRDIRFSGWVDWQRSTESAESQDSAPRVLATEATNAN